jgi:hypothetical protein
MKLLSSPGNFRDAAMLAVCSVLAVLAISVCSVLDDSSDGEALNPLEAAAEELLPSDAIVLERTDSVCTYGVPQPSCEFIRYIRQGVPQARRVADARQRKQALGWSIVEETHFDGSGQGGGVLLEIARDERAARWWLLADDDNQECIDHTDPPISCADQIEMC